MTKETLKKIVTLTRMKEIEQRDRTNYWRAFRRGATNRYANTQFDIRDAVKIKTDQNQQRQGYRTGYNFEAIAAQI